MLNGQPPRVLLDALEADAVDDISLKHASGHASFDGLVDVCLWAVSMILGDSVAWSGGE